MTLAPGDRTILMPDAGGKHTAFPLSSASVGGKVVLLNNSSGKQIAVPITNAVSGDRVNIMPDIGRKPVAMVMSTFECDGKFKAVYQSPAPGDRFFGVTFSDVIYIGGGVALAAGTVGVYRSTDYGKTWSLAQAISLSPYVGYMECLCDLGGGVLAGACSASGTSCHAGFYKSYNYGETWVKTEDVFPHPDVYNIGILDIAYLGNGIVIAVGEYSAAGRIWAIWWRSVDSGESWASVLSIEGIYPGTGELSAQSICDLGGGVVLSGTQKFGGGAVYRSTDYGATWYIQYNFTGQVWCFAKIDSLTALCSGGASIYKTVNSGITWSLVQTLPVTVVGFLLNLDGTTFHAGTSPSFWKSTDGGVTWVGDGITGTAISAAKITDTTALACGDLIYKLCP